MELHDRVALVTGADRGIGRAVALALAGAGAHVVVGYRTGAAEADAVAAEVRRQGRRATALRADLADPAEAARLAREAAAALGDVDVLVSNAGVGTPAALDALTLDLFDRTFAVNVRAAFVLTQAVLPAMRRRRFGRLLYVGSTAARVGGVVGPHYAASKAALEGLAHGYASRLAAEGVTANVLAPALVETAMVTSNPEVTPARIPVGRLGRPEEAAAAAVAILANPYLTGQTIQVNGGIYFT